MAKKKTAKDKVEPREESLARIAAAAERIATSLERLRSIELVTRELVKSLDRLGVASGASLPTWPRFWYGPYKAIELQDFFLDTRELTDEDTIRAKLAEQAGVKRAPDGQQGFMLSSQEKARIQASLASRDRETKALKKEEKRTRKKKEKEKKKASTAPSMRGVSKPSNS